MGPPARPDVSALRTEARNLEYLLRSYLDDKAFVAQPGGKLVYFVDAHELKSYLDPDNSEHLKGFLLEAEQAHHAASASAFEFQMRLRNEQLLHALLFEPSHQVGILPSHCAEVDEEIAFHAGKRLRNRVALLPKAREEVRKLRHKQECRDLLARLNNPQDETAKRDIVRYFGERAPMLLALIRRNPEDVQQRIEALIHDSNLLRAQDLDWERLGFDRATSRRLRELQPPRERLENWWEYLSERKERERNSPRANRIDGEAIAYLQALNEILAQSHGPPVRARFVTRAMTLVHSVAELKPNPRVGVANFLRHPRLLALQEAPGSSRSGGDRASGVDTERALMVALQTYRRQLDKHRYEFEQNGNGRSNAVETIVEAWDDFERARLTIELQTQASNVLPKDEAELSDPDFHELLQWFGGDVDVAGLINDELREAVRRFGHATFALQKAGSTVIGAQVMMIDHPKRVRVLPMIPGAPGPIEFVADVLQSLTTRLPDLATILDNLSSVSAERYVAWSLLLACQKKWSLADIYARSAIAIGEVERPGASGIADEAHLLRAQIQRLSGERSVGDEHDAEEPTVRARRRYQLSMEMLGRFKRERDPRWAREQAAQILELRLTVKENAPGHASIAAGIEWLHRALEWAHGDRVLRPRILELGLTYHLAASVYPDFWSGRNEADIAVARGWHKDLQVILTKQRNDPDVEAKEISQRARALEMLAFRFLPPEETRTGSSGLGVTTPERGRQIPPDLIIFARDLRDEIRHSTDNCAKLITQALDSIIQRRLRRRDLIYAPIWASHRTEWIVELIDDTAAREFAQSAYRDLSNLTGGSQDTAVTQEDRPVLEKIARKFESAARILQQATPSGNECADQAVFYTRMETCYAKLLLALMEQDNRNQQLENLIREYQAIADDYPKAAIPHFRLDTIFSELGKSEQAFRELANAVKLVDADPYLRTPSHWVRSTLQRRVASRFSQEAAQQRRRLSEQPTPELLESYLQNLLAAFRSIYTDCSGLPAEETDFLYGLEARRRVNNVLYYASLVLEIRPGSEGFRLLGLEEVEMRKLLSRLVPEGNIDNVLEIGIIHTIGAAYAALGEIERAAEAGNRLLEVAKETEDATDVPDLLNDAFMWIQGKSPLSQANAMKSSATVQNHELALL